MGRLATRASLPLDFSGLNDGNRLSSILQHFLYAIINMTFFFQYSKFFFPFYTYILHLGYPRHPFYGGKSFQIN